MMMTQGRYFISIVAIALLLLFFSAPTFSHPATNQLNIDKCVIPIKDTLTRPNPSGKATEILIGIYFYQYQEN